MQFIGLYDKNKKEIYDGDILKYSIQDENQLITDFMQVFYNNNIAAFVYDSSDFCQDCEIVGNIFETPNLLEGLKNK